MCVSRPWFCPSFVMGTSSPIQWSAPVAELCGLVPDPDTDPPDGDLAWLADVPSVVLHAMADAQAAADAGPADRFFCGGWSGIGEPGAGFAAGGPADELAPGTVLAGL